LQEAWSRLKTVLDRQGLSTADLVRRVSEQGDRVNAKSLYRLADPQEPLEKVDMRVIGAVCQALLVGIGDILTFDEPTIIEELDRTKQARLDGLLSRRKHGGQALAPPEMVELNALMDEAEAVARGNARRLANQKRRIQRSQGRPVPKSDSHAEGD
jgi:DNA-binding Xre family transcriptional regulator